MRLGIFAIGKMKKGPEADLYARYAGRIGKAGRPVGITDFETREWNESRAQTVAQRRDDEAASMLAAVPERALFVLLDETGEDATSETFAGFVQDGLGSSRDMIFGIGGPDGSAGGLFERADRLFRFGAMTWPHQLVRVMLAEQLYRATTILTGHPYHRR